MVGRSRPRFGALLAAALLASACKDLLPERRPTVSADSALPPVPAKVAPARRAPTPGNLENENKGFDQIRRSLRRLVAEQEGFFAENGVYTADFERLGFRPEGGSEIRFLWVKRDGWAASGTHTGIKGKDCVVFVGRTSRAPATQKYGRRSRAGAIVCDAQAPPPPAAAAPAAAPPPTTATTTPRAAQPDTGNALDAVDPLVVMKVDLRNLIRSQDTYFATQGVYARRTDPLPLQYLWHKGVSIRILSASRDSWSARATHVSRPGTSCVIWYGPVSARPETEVRKRVPDRSAVPVCDE